MRDLAGIRVRVRVSDGVRVNSPQATFQWDRCSQVHSRRNSGTAGSRSKSRSSGSGMKCTITKEWMEVQSLRSVKPLLPELIVVKTEGQRSEVNAW